MVTLSVLRVEPARLKSLFDFRLFNGVGVLALTPFYIRSDNVGVVKHLTEEIKMATLQASRVKEALIRASSVGRIEETVNLADCEIVFRSLGPDEFEAIVKDCEELEDVEYLHAYQIGHLCRSIVQFESVDLRGVDLVEVEIEDRNNPGSTVVKKVEIAAWLRDNYVRKWGKEAISIGFRKVAELMAKAEEEAKKNIKFDLPDELDEDKYRRLLSEIREIEENLPEDLSTKALEDFGYAHRSTPEELAEVERRVREFSEEQAALATEVPPPPKSSTPPNVEDLMKNRQPLNTPIPATSVPSVEIRTTSDKSSRLAALEKEVDPGILDAVQAISGTEVPEYTKISKIDIDKAAQIVDQPPIVGINPRFRKRPQI